MFTVEPENGEEEVLLSIEEIERLEVEMCLLFAQQIDAMMAMEDAKERC